jgi:16S rRNA (guanine(966)-N(2))-methyltransferase RsmD
MYIFSGELKNRKVDAPTGLATRPTSGRMRETFFNICQTLIADSHFLDLFAGSGIMGIEALSRGAASATFVDQSMDSIRCIKENLKNLGLEGKATVIHTDVYTALERLQKKGAQFDLIYADPPYEHQEDLGCNVITALDKSTLLKPNSWIFLEESSRVILPTKEFTKLKLHSYRKSGRTSLYEFKVEGSS